MPRLINFFARIIWWRNRKVSEISSRLFYQSFLIHLMRECNDPKDVEKELWNAGYDIGTKLYHKTFSKLRLPKDIPELAKFGKASWKIFTGDWLDEIFYKEDENLIVGRIKDCFYCRDLILPPDFKFHACELVGGIYSSALTIWLKEKKLPYTVAAHEGNCKMMGDDFCDLRIKFKREP